MPYLLQPPRAVHGGRLVQTRVDGRYGGQVDDAGPTKALPDGGEGVDPGEGIGIRVQGLGLEPNGLEHPGDDAVTGHEVHHHPRHDDRRQEVGQIADCLGEFLEFGRPDLIDHKGEENWHPEPHHQVQQVQYQGIAQYPGKVIGADELLEPLKSHPGDALPEERLPGHIVLECDRDAEQGQIAEYENQDQRDAHHQVILYVLFHIPLFKCGRLFSAAPIICHGISPCLFFFACFPFCLSSI